MTLTRPLPSSLAATHGPCAVGPAVPLALTVESDDGYAAAVLEICRLVASRRQIAEPAPMRVVIELRVEVLRRINAPGSKLGRIATLEQLSSDATESRLMLEWRVTE